MRARERLAAFLTWSGMTQTALAERLGVHQTAVGRYLRGRRPEILPAARLERLTAEHLVDGVAWPDGPLLCSEWVEDIRPEAPTVEAALTPEVRTWLEAAALLEGSELPTIGHSDPAIAVRWHLDHFAGRFRQKAEELLVAEKPHAAE